MRIESYKKFILERFKLSNLESDDNLKMLNISVKEDDYHLFLVYNILNKEPVGYISFFKYPIDDLYTVGGAYTNPKYTHMGIGPFLYESAMTMVYPNALSLSRDSNTSDDALEVWEKFTKRSDVKTKRMYSDEITHKNEILAKSNYYDDDDDRSERHHKRILELEDTKFYYSYGKDKLKNILKIGKDYQKKIKLSDLDIEYMSWDIEI